MKRALPVFVLLSVFLVSCSVLGYVPQADLAAAQAAQVVAASERDAAQAQVAALQAQVGNLQGQIDAAENRLDALICSDHTIEDFFGSQGFEVAGDDFSFTVWYTQWTTAPWSDNRDSTTLLVDDDNSFSMVLDTDENCVILNPDFWGDSFFR